MSNTIVLVIALLVVGITVASVFKKRPSNSNNSTPGHLGGGGHQADRSDGGDETDRFKI